MKGIRALVLCLMVLCLAATGCIPVPVAVPVQQNGYYTVPRTYYGYPQQGYYYRPVPPPAPHYVPYVPRRQPVRVYVPQMQYGSGRVRRW